MKRAYAFAFSIVLLSHLACRSTNSSLDVVGGTFVRADDPIVVHTVALVDTGSEPEEYCTGVMIAPQAILTAAHCFLTAKDHPMIFFGKSIPKSKTKTDKRFVDFREVIVHPDFSQKRLEAYDKKVRLLTEARKIPVPKEDLNDLALVLFEGPAPKDFAPAGVATTLPLEGALSDAAGFGCLSTDCENYSARLRKVEMRLARPLGETNMLLMNAGENKGTCAGDSGGPDFVTDDGGLKLLSIVSTGPESCEAGLSIETRVAPYLDWIQSVTKS
jgi:secreted trypsin-like serine protease